MKIGILTLPLGSNVGGVLQAFALQKYLMSLGYEVVILDRRRNDDKITMSLHGVAHFILGHVYTYFKLLRYHKIYSLNKFIKDYMICSPRLYDSRQLSKYIKNKSIDYLIVGSDQVWRKWNHDPGFTNIREYFFDFLIENANVEKIAYAVSFGTEEWDVGSDLESCRKSAQLFKAISVREKSGVEICKNSLGLNAIQVLDPTMLLKKEVYQKVMRHHQTAIDKNFIFCYFLDKFNTENIDILKLEEFSGCTSYDYKEKNRHGLDATLWLNMLYNSKFVITDSFHGCVFSILFNKPFVALGNKLRGQARFESLLSTFNLLDRLISGEQPEQIKSVLEKDINWSEVNDILESWRRKSFNFIINSLS